MLVTPSADCLRSGTDRTTADASDGRETPGGTPGLDCSSTCNEAEIQEGENRADLSTTKGQS